MNPLEALVESETVGINVDGELYETDPEEFARIYKQIAVGNSLFQDRRPEKPDGDRDSITLTAHDLTIETLTDSERAALDIETTNYQEAPGVLDEGSADPDLLRRAVNMYGDDFAEAFWFEWMQTLLSHRRRPIRLFDTYTVEKSGVTAHVVKKDTYGRNDRPVLKRSKRFERHMLDAGKSVCLQYAINSDKEPHEVCKEVPYDFFPYEVYRVREFVEEHGMIWACHDKQPWWDRTLMGVDRDLQGILYFMYTLEDDVVPRYIGISRLDDRASDGLNWNFANVTSDSVFARWGYGKSQHLGELSCAVWPHDYPWEPSRKYRQWSQALFFQNTRVLNRPVYIEVLPWLNDDLPIGEQNLITLSSRLFGDRVLNVEHFDDGVIQKELP